MNKKDKKNTKVLVAMSGGVDSSVSAALLVREGFNVTGAFMINYNTSDKDCSVGSCWKEDYQDALRVAAKLGIKLLRLDFTKEYKKNVLDYLYSEYKNGKTPNPDILCNKYIKFGAWLDEALKLGFEYMATGHYADLKYSDNKYNLIKAKDAHKDQTYFLNQLNQSQLSHIMFPIGKYKKEEVRDFAHKFQLATADKADSMGICLVGDVPMKQFLLQKISKKSGDIITSDGNKVGQHDGIAFYTIGQKVGLQKTRKDALYVVKKDQQKNLLIVGKDDDPLLFSIEILIKDVNWISGLLPKFPLKCEVRLRHCQILQKVIIQLDKTSKNIIIKFNKTQRAVASGQFAVFYKDNKCLGGGVII